MADQDHLTVTTSAEVGVAHAWFIRCVDGLHAALLLRDRHLASAADPLLRAAMEHAVGITWLRHLGDAALVALARSHKRWANNVQKATEAANKYARGEGREEWPSELDMVFEEIAAQTVPEGSVDGEWRIDKRFQVAKEFDLYVAWLSETGSSHATQVSASPYLIHEGDRYLLLRSPRSSGDTVELRCAAIAVTAFRAIGEILHSAIWEAKTVELDEQLGVALEKAKAAGLVDLPSQDDWSRRFDR